MNHISWNKLFGASLDSPRDPVVVIGVDLGTTYSTVTRIAWSGDPGDAPELEVLPILQRTSAGSRRNILVPSVVARRADGSVAIGEEARDVVRERGRPAREGLDTFTTTKNDMGTRKQYAKAPEELRTPMRVAEHILRFLIEGAKEACGDQDFDRVVVTVPASFQLTQRDDTIKAALAAGLDVEPYDLLDEPVAAFLSFHAGSGEERQQRGRFVVLDVGGGTCDLALLSVEPGSDDGQLTVNVAGTSRYSRLGGADIDRAIVCEHLLPAVAEINGVDSSSWSYRDVAAVLIPALTDTAEELKLKLNRRMADRRSVGAGFEGLTEQTSRDVSIPMIDGSCLLLPAGSAPLTSERFGQMVHQFVDPEATQPLHGEYFEASSVFVPLKELLSRRQWDLRDGCHFLLAGGSGQLVALADAISEAYGIDTQPILPGNDEDAQSEVSQGAALQAFSLALNESNPLVVPRSDEALSVLTADGPLELVPAGCRVPWPDDPLGAEYALTLAEGTEREGLRLTFSRSDVTVRNEILPLPRGVKDGDRFTLRATIDENQNVHLECALPNGERRPFSIERPWTYVTGPQEDRLRILQLEEDFSDPGASSAQKLEIRRELVGLYRAVGHLDKALESARIVLENAHDDDDYADAANAMAQALWDKGAREPAINLYARAASRGATWMRFNLANRLHRMGRFEEALTAANEVSLLQGDGPSYALQGKIRKSIEGAEAARADFELARAEFGHPATARPFEFAWMEYVAEQLGDKEWLRSLAQVRRSLGSEVVDRGVLPELGLLA